MRTVQRRKTDSVILLLLAGGRSHLDTFDFKPTPGKYRNAWQYRDYVIGAVSKNIPQDRAVADRLAYFLCDLHASRKSAREPLFMRLTMILRARRARQIRSTFRLCSAKPALSLTYFVKTSTAPQNAVIEDLGWALVNKIEFLFNY